ncbi:hypothetical protein, partial [Streptomyces sp. S1]|uniref:hypothetical protein n=1 Tax=Streptomyces sp. S1 TaxID=718288 RepID=UPI0013CF1DD5
MPTEEELKDPWVARLFLKNPSVVPKLAPKPPKPSAPRPSSDTNSDWQEFQKEIRGEVVSIKEKLVALEKGQLALEKGQKKANKLMRSVIKMLAANFSEKGKGKAHTEEFVSSRQKPQVHTADNYELKPTSPHIGTEDDVMFDSDVGAVADMGVQAAMEFLTAEKVIVPREDVKVDENKVLILL